MPELPEVETVRTVLEREVTGAVILGVETNPAFPGVLGMSDALPDPALLHGSRILSVHRRGKYLLMKTDSPWWIIVHLRMTGRLLAVPTTNPPVRFEHLVMHLDGDRDLRFADQRKFGRVVIGTKDDVANLDRRLGVEPLSRAFTSAWLLTRLARRPGPIKAVLLDQGLIAGLGNIYVDEALFRARIHPQQPANTLTDGDCRRLVRAIRGVLRSSIANQGTTFSSFENPYGESGSNAAYLHVYGKGRTAGTCVRCGDALAFIRVGGRGTSFCPSCQTLESSDPPSVDA